MTDRYCMKHYCVKKATHDGMCVDHHITKLKELVEFAFYEGYKYSDCNVDYAWEASRSKLERENG